MSTPRVSGCRNCQLDSVRPTSRAHVPAHSVRPDRISARSRVAPAKPSASASRVVVAPLQPQRARALPVADVRKLKAASLEKHDEITVDFHRIKAVKNYREFQKEMIDDKIAKSQHAVVNVRTMGSLAELEAAKHQLMSKQRSAMAAVRRHDEMQLQIVNQKIASLNVKRVASEVSVPLQSIVTVTAPLPVSVSVPLSVPSPLEQQIAALQLELASILSKLAVRSLHNVRSYQLQKKAELEQAIAQLQRNLRSRK
eukprot:TRINITY_DN9683_c0_g1_i5.p1 TRINITY_DN9683_c0_g1~~TRINITY_DN9683_c0_g1_i5.p1  ORF type:complete len:255 (+),score=82.28 TRINITY_DN9683_c0_g1_i5:681-1445(+)